MDSTNFKKPVLTISPIKCKRRMTMSNSNKNCCRLCLAPENECVEIFSTKAADKQPIQSKISSCLQIQVIPNDRLSVNICHACISYLNSWQSFKNRCDAAQRKQRIWLTTAPSAVNENNVNKVQISGQSLLKNHLNGQQRKVVGGEKEKQVEVGKAKNVQQDGIDTSFIKSEPASDDEDVDEENVMELDPSQFLAQGSSDEDDSDGEVMTNNRLSNGNVEQPTILTSLGLTHINNVQNPYSSYANSDDSTNDDKSEISSLNGNKSQVPANCTVCNMQFSNRANARRHEKNIHKIRTNIQQQPLQPQQQISLVKKKATSTVEIDYTKPELYRHLLTPTKLTFILNNLNFLEQAQDMTCKCCNKKFPSYKFFMGHMRKKYHGLPRNVCFKCLRQFDSKGQFIGHLKRPGNSCPNLYRLVMADESIPKNLIPTDTNLRIPAKDVLNNRVYACALCDDTFRLKSDFREHVYGTHLEVTKNRETPNASCINCNESFSDSAVRRRHFNNLDCIVYIVCNTCGEQFPSQAIYLEHVYQTHLNAKENEPEEESFLFEEPPEEADANQQNSTISPGNKSIQKCPVCNKQYNNYYNVLRHMEAKHPDQVPQTYQCPECPDEKFSKQTYLREHLIKVHNKLDVTQRELMQHQINHQNNNGNKVQSEVKEGGENHHELKSTTPADTDDDENSNNKLSTSSTTDQSQSFKCRLCAKRIATKTGLQKHMIKVHQVGGELVKCTLCPADFANDKGLKVHLWRCHEIREADYENVLPPDLLDPYTQQQRKLKQEEEQKSILMANESGNLQQQKVVYECPFCHIVYHTKEEHVDHQKTTHAMNDEDILDPDDFIGHEEEEEVTMPPTSSEEQVEYWFQCRFCQRSFNSSKKLTIHMNSHQESSNGKDENGGYPCKECNIVYKSKKSLWVHRHKKHPRHPVPSHCDACEKTFFDQNELILHMQHAHPGNIPVNHQEREEKENNSSLFADGHWLLDESNEMKAPSQPSFDSTTKKRKRPAPSETPDGQFACDMCPKCFSNANALQVHRGWHFRSPDGRKVKDPSQMWHPDQTPPSKVRRVVTPQQQQQQNISIQPICPHCNQKFASQNNLRRHIIEVHKTRENSTNSHEIKTDRTGECTKCNLTFSTVAEWVQHKINDAKNRKAESGGGGYDWNCEICLKQFTRRERLMQHMLNHLSDREMDPDVLRKNYGRAAHQDLSSEEEEEEEDDEEEVNQPVNSFSCDMCNVKFTNSGELRAHVVAEHFLNGSAGVKETEKLEIDEEVEKELDNVEFEEAEIDFDEDEEEEEESSSSATSSSESSVKPPIARIQVQLHRCRICNSAFIEQGKAVECMVSHQDRVTSHKCNDCQLYFKDSNQLTAHYNLCHS